LQIVNVRAPGQQTQKTTNVGQQPTRVVNVVNPSQLIRAPNSTVRFLYVDFFSIAFNHHV
jgi:hypothetical protein